MTWHDMAYGDFRVLARKTAFDKVLRDKAFNITKNPKYDGYQRRLASMLTKFLDKKSAGSGVNMHASNKIKQNQCHLAMHQLTYCTLLMFLVFSVFVYLGCYFERLKRNYNY